MFGSTNNVLVDKFVSAMTGTFQMSMIGELSFFLGLQIKQSKSGLFLSQEKYARNLVKRFGLDGSKTSSSPMSSTLKLSKSNVADTVDTTPDATVDPTLYRSMIGSLLYLSAS